jgi:LysM repeat protein
MNGMKKIRHFLLLFMGLAVLAAFRSPAEKSPQEKYIEKYSALAVEEMYRSGIPASITLAQGLLESGSGRSELAVKSNNHFGIKCHNNWDGKKVYHDDDEKGECFRKYPKPEDSYRDHSDFLRYRARYRFLFDYPVTDYKAWAFGLKKAGYATDPEYPTKLIKLIEDYELHQYDRRKSATSSRLPVSPAVIEQVKPLSDSQREEFHFILSREMYSKNGVPFVYSVEGETYESIAASNRLFLGEILRFNDASKTDKLAPGTVVYLQAKKKQAVKGLDKHVVEEGESLRGISQKYAMRLSKIYKINGFDSTYVPKEGDIIKLRK